jgi:hypothetical protein
MPLSKEQILALAPDDASAKAGSQLATPSKWVEKNVNEKAIWGACQGSGKNPYLTFIDLLNIAFKCNCPSRKFPCKHGLGLYLLYAQSPKMFSATTTMPESLMEWLDKRQAKTEEKTEKADKPVDEAAREKRQEARRKKVDRGIEELQGWVKDMVRGGIINMPQQYHQLIPAMASRMVDAQAPGLAAQVRRLGSINFYEEGWQTNFLRKLANIYLATLAYSNKEHLEPLQQTDSDAFIGFSPAKEDVLAGETVDDEWLILSKNYSTEENLTTETVWFWGQKTGRFAYHLQFFAGTQITELLLMPGTVLHGELAFFPGSFPLRALIKTQQQTTTTLPAVHGLSSMDEVKEKVADIFSVHPFLENIPVMLQNAGLAMENDRLMITDTQGKGLTLLNKKEQLYRLLASTKGNRFNAFALFTESSIQVKSLINQQEIIAVS